MKVGIVGMGHVGKAMQRVFPDAVVYDKFDGVHDVHNYREAVDECDVALVCVPTPALASGRCDLTAIEDVIGWLRAGVICIKSTVPPGTTERLRRETGKRIVMSPEYEGETPWQADVRQWPYVIAGGDRDDAQTVLNAFRERLGPEKSYWATDSTTAELVKFMENAWLAMQVTFAGEFYEIAQAVGADYNQARELWALDPRVSKWHTLVFPSARGFAGRCLPKDLAAIICASQLDNYDPRFLRAIQDANERFQTARDPVLASNSGWDE